MLCRLRLSFNSSNRSAFLSVNETSHLQYSSPDIHCFAGNLFAGHSKWANIKHIKSEKDAARSALHQKIVRQCKAVIREHGSADPKSNLQLAHIIEQARKHNVPGDKIQSILNGGNRSKDLKPYILEIRGPSGCFFVLEVQTASYITIKNSVTAINKRFQCQWADGISSHLFTQKGLIEVIPITDNQTLEQALDDAIEIGAEDVTAQKDDGGESFVFTTDPTDYYSVKKCIIRKGYKILDSSLQFLPKNKVTLSESDLELAKKIYHKLEEEEDIVKIYDNIE